MTPAPAELLPDHEAAKPVARIWPGQFHSGDNMIAEHNALVRAYLDLASRAGHSGASVEEVSRRAFPEAWAKVDSNIFDDDWMGATALNYRYQLLKQTTAVIDALTPREPGGKS